MIKINFKNNTMIRILATELLNTMFNDNLSLGVP
jgi:hypothetical protein